MTHDEHIRFCGESLTWSHIANLAIHAVLFLQYVTMRIVYRKGPEIDEVEWNCILRATIGRASKTKTHISHSLAIYSLDFTFVLAIIMTYDQFSEKINLRGLFWQNFFFIILPTYVLVFKIQNLGPPQSVFQDIQLISHRQVKCTKFTECAQNM